MPDSEARAFVTGCEGSDDHGIPCGWTLPRPSPVRKPRDCLSATAGMTAGERFTSFRVGGKRGLYPCRGPEHPQRPHLGRIQTFGRCLFNVPT